MSKNRIKELELKINQARKEYYNGQSTISDQLFDALVDELSELDPKNLAVIGIGSEPVSVWEKFTHKVPMGSLNKSQTAEEYIKWHEKYIGPKDKVLLTLKLDGLSVSLIYENGKLVNASTRGSGVVGEIITPNVAQMIGVPLKLKEKIDITVRGEILISKEMFNNHFSEYSNPRNAASGVSRRFEGTNADKLSVLVYNLVSDLDFNTQEEQFNKLKELGFNVPKYYVLSSAKEVLDYKDKYQSKLRDEYEYELDGLVVHQNNLYKHSEAGVLNGRPYASIAIKFDSVAKEGCISDILIQVGNSGRLTPVAVFNPKVRLTGADVEKATLHNFGNINNLGIDIGAKVLVCRSNDVIPFVLEVSESTGTIFSTPTNCPECGTKVVETGEYVQCPNTATCPAQVAGRLINYIKELNVLEWGDKLLANLASTGKATNVAELYKLSVDDLASLDRMGEKSATKCHEILHANKTIALEVLLGALSIPMIGQSTVKAVMGTGCTTLEQFYKLSVDDFERVPGLGPNKAKSLFDGLRANKGLIDDLLSQGIKIKEIKVGNLSNMSFCLTGAMVNKRQVLESMIADAGGIVKSGVNKDLSFLVIADVNSTSSKAVNARKFGTKLISEDQLLEMLNC